MSIFNFDLQYILKYSLMHSFAENIPYSLYSIEGQLISSSMPQALEKDIFSRDIEYSGIPILTLKGLIKKNHESNSYLNLEKIIIQDLSLYHKMNLLLAKNEFEKSSFEEIINIFGLFQSEKYQFKNILEKALLLLRTYIPVETCSIFQALIAEEENQDEDEKEKNVIEKILHGIAGIRQGSPIVFKKNSHWEINEYSILGITAINQQYYISPSTSSDPNYKAVSEYEPPSNLACFPLTYNNSLLGVLNLKNNIKGFYNPEDINFIRKFSILLSHLMFNQDQEDHLNKLKNVNTKLGKYVSHNVVEDIKKAGDVQKRGEGIKKNAVCLFCDIRSFTSISEKLTPTKLVSLLNVYFSELIPIVEKYEGTVDKLVGDMIAAFWNLPQDVIDPELKAVKAAIEMQKVMIQKVVPIWTEAGVPRIGIGIGLYSGQVIAGNLGASQLMNYTVMGNTVHNAELLESKARPGEIWISEKIFKLTEGKILKHLRIEDDLQFNGISKKSVAYVLKPIEYPDY